MNEKDMQLFIFFMILLVFTVITAQKNPLLNQKSNYFITAAKQQDTLLNEITDKSTEFEEKPQDAYIDRVWKKTPGRNGRKVNIEKSYENMKIKNRFDKSLLVFEEISPSISLSDLPASPIYRGHPEKEMVALLINVSWGTEHIPSILSTLKKQDVKATFFIEGKWAKENKNIVNMIHEQNHLIGSHAYNHPNMAHISKQEITEQLVKTNEIIEAIIGYRPKWFAPPSGSYNQQVVQIAHELDMETILWTVDTIDWKNPSLSVMINRVMTNIHPGATILMHPTDVVVQGIDQLIDEIKRKNYKLGTIEQLLSEKR